MAEKKHAGGRPPIKIDWEIVERLCRIQCTLSEIAGVIGVHKDTITNRLEAEKGISFSAYFEEKAASGRGSLRRKQFEIAMNGNVTMLIWLGKQYLGQRDKQEIHQESDPLAELIAEFKKEHERLQAVPGD